MYIGCIIIYSLKSKTLLPGREIEPRIRYLVFGRLIKHQTCYRCTTYTQLCRIMYLHICNEGR